jgi:hypothetical protein
LTDPHPAIPVPTGFHAFLLASVIASDPGRGNLINLELPDGTAILARATPTVLRLGSGINGAWRATLHFSTTPDGHLNSPVTIQRLRPPTPEFETVETFWSTIGELETLELDARLITVRVFPERARRAPFTVTAILDSSLGFLEHPKNVTHVRLSGHLEKTALVATEIEAVEISRPAQWLNWTPRTKPKNPR